jgi:hypothetical protein
MGNCIGKKSRTSNKHHSCSSLPSIQINILPSEQSNNHHIEPSISTMGDLFSKEIKSGKLFQTEI